MRLRRIADLGHSAHYTRVSLKPRLSNSIGMFLGGCFIAWFGIAAAVHLGGYAGLFSGVLGVLGTLWIALGILALARRSRLAIVIDESGIEFPAFRLYQRESRRVRIPREDIATISKHESMKGRLIEIATLSRGHVLLQARHYCELDDFISHCRSYGLPVA